MADPLSIAGSVVGIVALSGEVFRFLSDFKRQATGAHSTVIDLARQTRNLSGVLQNLSLLAVDLEDDLPGYVPTSFKAEHLHACQQSLRKIQQQLKKAQDEFESGKKMKSIIRSLKWPFSVDETKELLAGMASHRETLELALSADTMVTLRQSLTTQKVILGGIEALQDTIERKIIIDTRVELNKKRKEIVSFFLKVNPQPNFQTCLQLRQPMTGLWLTESNPEYLSWKTTDNSRIWLSGIPGAGKTVLCGAVIDDVLQESSLSTAVAFFFCDYKSNETQDLTNILCSLAIQIAQQHDAAFEILEAYYDELHPKQQLPKDPTSRQLFLLMLKLLAIYDRSFLVIDGLDECGSGTHEVARVLRKLAEDSSNVSIAIFSRDEPDIREELMGNFEYVEIAAHTQDIDLFRWVACQLDHLCTLPSDRARRKALKDLPPTLFGTYDRILENLLPLAKESQMLVRDTLYWIATLGYMPVNALCEAVSIQEDSDGIEADDLIDEDEILRRCSSLVRKSSSTDGVSDFEFAHFTVKEYLRNIEPQSPLATFRYAERQSFYACAKTAVRFITFREFNRRPMVTAEEPEYTTERNKRHPFYSWAANVLLDKALTGFLTAAWGDLYRDPSLAAHMKKLFDPKKSGYFLSWVTENISIRMPRREKSQRELVVELLKPEFTPLHVAAALSIPDACKALLEAGIDVNSCTRFGAPLHCALTGPIVFDNPFGGAMEATMFLQYPGKAGSFEWLDERESTLSLPLDHGADPTQKWRFKSAMAVAAWLSAKRADEQPLSVLLSRTSEVPDDTVEEIDLIGGGRDRNPNEMRFIDSISAVITKRIQDSASPKLWSLLHALQRVARKHKMQVTNLPRGMSYMSAMSDQNIINAVTEMVRFDLSDDMKEVLKYIRASREDIWPLHLCGESALHLAARHDSAKVGRLLLEAGLDANSRGVDDATSLHVCAEHNSHNMAQALLGNGALAGLRDSWGCTPWHEAAMSDSTDVLSTLLQWDKEKQRSIAKVSNAGHTALAEAIICGNTEAALMILDNFQCDGQLCQSPTPLLHAAASTGSEDLFRRLHAANIGLPEIASDGSTPLHSISLFSPSGFVELLKTLYDPLQPRHDGKIPLEVILGLLNDERLHPTPRRDSRSIKRDVYGVMELLIPPSHYLKRHGVLDAHVWEFFCLNVVRPFSTKLPSTQRSNRHPNRYDSGSSCTDTSGSLIDALTPDTSTGDESDAKLVAPRSRLTHICKRPCRGVVINAVLDSLVSSGVLASYEREGHRPAFQPLFSSLVARGRNNLKCQWVVHAARTVLKRSVMTNTVGECDDGKLLLVRAIEGNTPPLVKALLHHEFDVFETIGKLSPIEVACKNADIPVFCAVLAKADSAPLKEKPLIHLLISSNGIWAMEKTKRLLTRGSDPNMRSLDSEQMPAIVFAAHERKFNVADILAKHGADRFAISGGGYTMAHAAVLQYNFQFLKFLRRENPPQSFWESACGLIYRDRKGNPLTTGSGCTILHAAAIAGSVDVLEYILDEGLCTDMNALAAGGMTPLFLACICGREEAVKTLIERGGDVNVRNEMGKYLIDATVEFGEMDIGRILVESGAQGPSDKLWGRLLAPNTGAGAGESGGPKLREGLLTRALRFHSAMRDGDLAQCQDLVRDGYDLEAPVPSCRGCPPLFEAVRSSQPGVVDWLISAGASPDYVTCDEDHYTPYWGVVQSAAVSLPSMTPECVEGLLDYALACKIDSFNWPFNPLHLAVIHNRLGILRVTLEHIKMNAAAYRSLLLPGSPIGAAASLPEGDKWPTDRASFVSLLLNRRSIPIQGYEHASWGEIARWSSGTPLHFAVHGGLIDILKLLIDYGADVNSQDRIKFTPLSVAAHCGAVDIGRILFESGAHINHRCSEGRTPLMIAAENDWPLMVTFLVEEGANINLQDHDGWNALHYTVEGGSPDIFAYLVEQGADHRNGDYKGHTPIEAALRKPAFESYVFNSGLARSDVADLGHLMAVAAQGDKLSFLRRLYRAFPEKQRREYVNKGANFWQPPLFCAAVGGAVRCARFLLEHGADLELEVPGRGTPLIAACSYGRLEMVKFLVLSRARLRYLDENGQWWGAFAAAQSFDDIQRWLLVGRFLESKRICYQPLRGEYQGRPVMPWSGVARTKVELGRMHNQAWNESGFEHLVKLEKIRRSWRGKLVGTLTGPFSF